MKYLLLVTFVIVVSGCKSQSYYPDPMATHDYVTSNDVIKGFWTSDTVFGTPEIREYYLYLDSLVYLVTKEIDDRITCRIEVYTLTEYCDDRTNLGSLPFSFGMGEFRSIVREYLPVYERQGFEDGFCNSIDFFNPQMDRHVLSNIHRPQIYMPYIKTTSPPDYVLDKLDDLGVDYSDYVGGG